MKIFLSLLFGVMILATCVSSSHAADGWEKIKGGIVRFVKSPIQLKEGIVTEYKVAEFKPLGIIGGTFKGLFYTVKEAVTGVWEIISMPAAPSNDMKSSN